MQVLFDQGTPAPLRQFLLSHDVSTAYERGWSTLKNGELLQAAELAGFEVLATTDTNLKYRQNLATRRISVVVLGTTSWPRIKASVEPVILTVNSAVPGGYAEVRIPWARRLTLYGVPPPVVPVVLPSSPVDSTQRLFRREIGRRECVPQAHGGLTLRLLNRSRSAAFARVARSSAAHSRCR